ncbi:MULTISPECIES: hypothetical protein [sulfur-oxidizing symbionts]|jgi:hypothetical protein|nr:MULTISPECIES: hypothetical protein [sulfur-oxidizing symbionts]
MVDLTNYCKTIQHAEKHGNKEMADCKAILFDMNDGGFVSSLGKKYGQACQVDYIEMIENRVILIELKDLKEQLKNKTSKDILNNLGKKYTKSIEIIQNAVPILYYVVVKNDTEIVVWDNLFSIKDIKIKFENTSFEICETNKICEKLSTLNTRLCQE